jgi:hypothetical protein
MVRMKERRMGIMRCGVKMREVVDKKYSGLLEV